MEIPRLKEHIYRCHYQTSCDRCLETFKQDKDLVAHRRQAKPCQRKDNSSRDPVIQGIGQDTMSMLKSRKRSSCKTAEEKWFEIWDILFPGVASPGTPYNDSTSLRLRSVNTASTLDYASVSGWWDPIADDITSRLFASLGDTLLSMHGSKGKGDLLPLIRGHINQAFMGFLGTGRCPVIQDSDTSLEPAMVHGAAEIPETTPRGSSNLPVDFANHGDENLWISNTPISPESMSSPCFTYVTEPAMSNPTMPILPAFGGGQPASCWISPFPLDGSFWPSGEEALTLETLDLGSGAIPPEDMSPIPPEVCNLGRHHGRWSI
ncbi:hypothetical protein PG999_012553 [Apiospora kogelbergensis]|uniref:C2H2-type domain-containing protein n=1 Tax=Apiospora kogelbergensis TaxID=1337665 RepID=A0AAW0QH59_9PEZI